MIKLNPITLKQKNLLRTWRDALTSGKYSQTSGALHKVGDGYCCLGVMCDVAAQKGLTKGVWYGEDNPDDEESDAGVTGRVAFITPEDDRSMSVFSSSDMSFAQTTTMPPPEINQLFGLTDDDANELARLNDAGFKFAQIALILQQAIDKTELLPESTESSPTPTAELGL